MIKQIEEILKEIYLIDPELKKHESELKKIMDEFIKQKPDTKFDQAFKEELKFKLLARAEELIEEKNKKQSVFQDLFILKNFSFALAGATLTLVIAVPVFLTLMNGGNKISKDFFSSNIVLDEEKLFESEIKNVKENAFGKLINNQTAENAPSIAPSAAVGGGSSIVRNVVGREASYSKNNVSNFLDNSVSSVSAPLQTDSAGIASDKMFMPPYETVNYKYVYKGEEFTLNNDRLLVYKKILEKSSGKDMQAIFKKFDLGVIDFDQFNDLKVKQVSLAEEKEFGFYINVDFENSLLSIYQNWNMWPRLDKDCRDDACFEQYRLKISDIPDDEKIVAIADEFIKKLGIDMSFYDKAEVLRYFEDQLKQGIPESDIWVPEEISVIYPLKFDDKIVYDSSGIKSGFNVNVNIRHMRVSGINQIGAQKYESSEYEAVTDVANIMKEVEKGGYMNYWYASSEEGKEVQVELGSPTLDLMSYYKYSEDSGESEELYVPALIFPVDKVSDDQACYNRKAVIVPLIQDLIMENDGGGFIGRPEPMPLIER